MRILRRFQIAIILTIIMTLPGCDSSRVFDENIALPDFGWVKSHAPYFTFNIRDTNALYNIYFNLRNSSSYSFSNIYLFIRMTSPSDKTYLDTLEITLADKNGRWNGSGVGNVWQLTAPLVEKARLNETGEYKVEVMQGMRVDTLTDIRNVGLRVEFAAK